MTHTLDIAALVNGARYCAQCKDTGYRPLYYLNVGRVFPVPCECSTGKEVSAMKQAVSKVWEDKEDWPR